MRLKEIEEERERMSQSVSPERFGSNSLFKRTTFLDSWSKRKGTAMSAIELGKESGISRRAYRGEV